MARRSSGENISSTALALILKPVVRLFLRRGLLFREFQRIARTVYIQVAEEEIRKTGDKVNISRLSVLTGIYRDDVKAAYDKQETIAPEPISVLGRVILYWEQDKRYKNKKNGEPKLLSCDGDNSEFFKLVRRISKSLNPATVLFEIQRNGAAGKVPGGLKLIRRTVAVGSSELHGFQLLSDDIDALISAVDFNIQRKDELGHLHLHTEYDRISYRSLAEIRRWLKVEGRVFHQKVREYLAQFDLNLNPDLVNPEEPPGRLVLGSFCFSDEKNSITEN